MMSLSRAQHDSVVRGGIKCLLTGLLQAHHSPGGDGFQLR